MASRKTYKKLGYKKLVKGTRKRKPITGGGFLWDSNREKITNHLLKNKAINKEQRKAILNASDSGSKKEKIQKFVDESVLALTQTIIEAWKQLPSEIKNTPNSSSLNKILNLSNYPTGKAEQYSLAHNLYKIYNNMDTMTRTKIFDDGLMKVKLSDGRNGGMAFQLLYQLYKNWIDSNVLQSLPSPKFADLYSNWFGKELKSFIQKYWWLFV